MDYFDSIEKQERESYYIATSSNNTSLYSQWLSWMYYWNPLFWIS